MNAPRSPASDAVVPRLGRLSFVLPVLSFAFAFALSLGVLVAFSTRAPHATDPRRLADVSALEPVIKNVATSGWAALLALEGAPLPSGESGESTLLLASAAWAKLSLGRLGWVSGSTAVDLPWLVLAAFAPALCLVVLRRHLGSALALFGAACTLALAIGTSGATAERVSVAGSGGLVFLVLAPNLALARRRSAPRVFGRAACVAAVSAFAFGFALSCAASLFWLSLIGALHSSILSWPRAARTVKAGWLAVPAFTVLGLPVALLLMIAQNPALWRAPIPRLVGAVVGAIVTDEAASPAVTGTWLLVTGLLALFCAIALSCFERPPANAALRSLIVLAACGFVVSWGARAVMPSALAPLRPELGLLWPFVALAVSAGAWAIWRRLRAHSD